VLDGDEELQVADRVIVPEQVIESEIEVVSDNVADEPVREREIDEECVLENEELTEFDIEFV
jgi:hypothetical protein